MGWPQPAHQQDERHLALRRREARLGAGAVGRALQAVEALCKGGAAAGQRLPVQEHADEEEELVLSVQQQVEARPPLGVDLQQGRRGRGRGASGGERPAPGAGSLAWSAQGSGREHSRRGSK